MAIYVSDVRAYNEQLAEENKRLREQIDSDKKMTEQWKMLSEMFVEEIRKACQRYGCEEMSI